VDSALAHFSDLARILLLDWAMSEPTPASTATDEPQAASSTPASPSPDDKEQALPGDYDAPWKAIAQTHMRSFLAFYFPRVEKAIDWTYTPRSLNTEFQGTNPRPEKKPEDAAKQDATKQGETKPPVDVRVDLLFEVKMLDGEHRTLMLHVEVQGDYETGFAMRMCVYCAWIFARHQLPVISLAILGDVDCPNWKPAKYRWDAAGCSLEMKFHVAKLMDYNGRWAELEASENPFALVTRRS
jgi:hypothetical protein